MPAQHPWYLRCKAQHRCVRCPARALPNRVLCIRHRDIASQERFTRYWRLKAQGLCVDCHAPTAFNHARCAECRADYRHLKRR